MPIRCVLLIHSESKIASCLTLPQVLPAVGQALSTADVADGIDAGQPGTVAAMALPSLWRAWTITPLTRSRQTFCRRCRLSCAGQMHRT